MPKFVKEGPVVPDELVQSLEDDRVVIFCGAGISMGAGLPSYGGLVKYCYNELAEVLPPKRAPEWLWPDRMLGSLEGKFGRAQVRDAVHRCLSAAPTSLDMHKAILRLAKLRGENGIRLVTTNFDTLFEQANPEWKFGKDLHSGPVLPIPRNDKAVTWRSVVYLHGRLDEVGANEHLVLTSADFGRSYLTDAWAARFVARLFSDFTVLFIGYSLNDPVLRYMTDAFAAENLSSRVSSKRSPAYIFVPHKGKGDADDTPYRHRNLRPIFYRETKDHRHLRNTIIGWADAREDYLENTLGLIARIAPKRPSTINPSDVANLVWAVCGRPSDAGHGAKAFADLETRPPIEWFDEFERREADILAIHEKAAAAARDEGDDQPPYPQLIVEPLFPRAHSARLTHLPPQSEHLARWLAQHVGDYGLASRLIQKLDNHRFLHPTLMRRIRQSLSKAEDVKSGLAKFWRLVTSTSDDTLAVGRLFPFELKVPETFAEDHDTLAFKVDLLSALSPSVSLSQPFDTRLPDFNPNAEGWGEEKARGTRFSEVVNAEVTIPGDAQVDHLVERILARDESAAFLASMLQELTTLLRRTVNLFTLIENGPTGTDFSVFHRPSIAPHTQNRDYENWTLIVTLIWHGWQHLDQVDAVASRRIIGEWLASEFNVIRRLGLAALNHSQKFTWPQKMEHLLDG
ncbi:SIR2 family protein [Stenotrophomonas sp. TEPEL]|uniref:SIR2 family protein n=1 Tax=Stenotrophomonas sp. TEPEL TaxID=2283801 RepID=UPI0014044250|nr:SIR2 family protein [Stenotrophomonas sp. TEPEL]